MPSLSTVKSNFSLIASDIGHTFSTRKRAIFSNISFGLHNNNIVGISGANGSGKSTLVKILCGAMTPAFGSAELSIDGQIVKRDNFRLHCGLVAPYLALYDEFTPDEHIRLIQDMRGLPTDQNRADFLLDMLAISKRRNDYIKTFSSGMQQRVKFIIAALHNPSILFLDEPSTNLDARGREAVVKLIRLHCDEGGGIILASNESQELSLCNTIISVDQTL